MIARLNDRWRVVDDPIQWILQYRRNKHGSSAEDVEDVWGGRRFFRTRTALLRDVRELCGPVDPSALRIIASLPDRHA
jgi:hypothetical protein